MTTLADAVAAPLAVWVGFWPFRRRMEFSPLTLGDAGAYERNATRRGGAWSDSALLCFLSARRADPSLTWRRFRRRTFGFLPRCVAAVRLANVALFLQIAKDDEESDGDNPTGDLSVGGIWREYMLAGWPPPVVAAMTLPQLAMYREGDSDTPTAPPAQWENVAAWRAAMKAAGKYEAIRGKGVS